MEKGKDERIKDKGAAFFLREQARSCGKSLATSRSELGVFVSLRLPARETGGYYGGISRIYFASTVRLTPVPCLAWTLIVAGSVAAVKLSETLSGSGG